METENNKRVGERLEGLEVLLAEYTTKLGLGRLRPPENVEHYLSLTQENLRSLSALDLGEIAILLSQHSMYIQRQENEQRVKRDWAKNMLNIVVGRQLSNYGSQFITKDEKFAKIVTSDSVALALNKIIVYAEAYLNELSYISKNVQTLVNCIIEYQKTKRSQQQ